MQEGRGLFKQKIFNWSGMSHATCSYRAFTFHFCGEFYTCKVNLPCAIYPRRGRKRGEMCVAPQLPHVVKRVGGKNPTLNLIFLQAVFFTRLFSSVYVTATALFTVHRKAKQPMFLHSHVSDFVRRLTFVYLVFLQPGSNSLLFCL